MLRSGKRGTPSVCVPLRAKIQYSTALLSQTSTLPEFSPLAHLIPSWVLFLSNALVGMANVSLRNSTESARPSCRSNQKEEVTRS